MGIAPLNIVYTRKFVKPSADSIVSSDDHVVTLSVSGALTLPERTQFLTAPPDLQDLASLPEGGYEVDDLGPQKDNYGGNGRRCGNFPATRCVRRVSNRNGHGL